MFITKEVLDTRKMFASNEISGIEDNNKSIEKSIKPKTRKLSKNQKCSKNQKLFKSKKSKTKKSAKSKKLLKIKIYLILTLYRLN